MGLLVETGTGMTLAQSYVSLTEADRALRAQGRTGWFALETQERCRLLMEASAWIDRQVRFSGQRLNEDQALAWPRQDAVDVFGTPVRGVPNVVRAATATLAGALAEAGDNPLGLERTEMQLLNRLDALASESGGTADDHDSAYGVRSRSDRRDAAAP